MLGVDQVWKMEVGWGPGQGEGGASAQVEQVEPGSSGVSRAEGSEAFLASRGRGAQAVGFRILLWETGFFFQTLPHARAMEEVRCLGSVWMSASSVSFPALDEEAEAFLLVGKQWERLPKCGAPQECEAWISQRSSTLAGFA